MKGFIDINFVGNYMTLIGTWCRQGGHKTITSHALDWCEGSQAVIKRSYEDMRATKLGGSYHTISLELNVHGTIDLLL